RVSVAGHEVGGPRLEGHEAAVGAERRGVARAVPLGSVAGHAHALGGAGLPVIDEHVVIAGVSAVAVPGHEAPGGRDEGDDPAVKPTVTVVVGRGHPVGTSGIERVATSGLSVWPASSESVSVPALVPYTRRLCRTRSVPALVPYTRRLCRTRGAWENAKVREV